METKQEQEDKDLKEQAKRLGVKPPKITIPANVQKDPAKFAKAQKAADTKIRKALIRGIEAAKKKAKQTPIDVRRECLEARFKVVRNRRRSRTYPDAMVKMWIKEYEILKNNPKLWNKETQNGTQPFPVAAKKNKSAAALLDAMDLD
jgi:hypothetical protein